MGPIDREAEAQAFAAGIEFVEPWLADAELKDAAIVTLRSYISTPDGLTPAIVELVERHGESLPDLLKREVHWKDPQTKLLDRAKCSLWWTSEPEPDFSPAVRQAQESYDAGIRAAVSARYAEQEKCREIWERARGLDVEVYDAADDEPPTGGVSPEPPPSPEELRQKEIEARVDRAQKFMQRASEKLQETMAKFRNQTGEWWTNREYLQAQQEFMAAGERMSKAAASEFADDPFDDVK
jgi:hypothetical protein